MRSSDCIFPLALLQVVVAAGSTEALLADVANAEPQRVLAIAGPGSADGAVLALAAANSGAAGPHAAGVLLTGIEAGQPALGPHACRVLRARRCSQCPSLACRPPSNPC